MQIEPIVRSARQDAVQQPVELRIAILDRQTRIGQIESQFEAFLRAVKLQMQPAVAAARSPLASTLEALAALASKVSATALTIYFIAVSNCGFIG